MMHLRLDRVACLARSAPFIWIVVCVLSRQAECLYAIAFIGSVCHKRGSEKKFLALQDDKNRV